VAPAIEDLGSLQELTLGRAVGLNFDADFPTGSLFIGELSWMSS
jgi:hypothetical protein